ncbi:hypothetical protein [Solirubrobacter soli]|uniref:hypothetical protein n=1 Tax=Solirubrobacter soli TaxID=363832 RepID=UPI00041A5441|nr:hypothetical protein [Solirubrobacter soli]
MLAAAAVVIAGCGDTASDTKAPATKAVSATTKAKPAAVKEKPKSDTEQLEHLLFERGWALEKGNTEDFLATSTGAQARKDKVQMARAKALPINDVKLTAGGTEINGDKATMRVEMRYGFDNIDTAYFKTSRMSAVKTPQGWRISNDRPSAGMLAPWEYTAYKARKSPHFLALAPKSLKVGSLMTDLEKGYNRMKRGLPGVKPPRKVLVIVARTGTDTKALTKDIKTLKSLTAVAENQYSTKGSAKRIDQVWGQRVFVLWRSYGNRGADERRMVVTHELVHTALASRTSARTPPWLSEGIAMYISGDNRSGDAGALISGRGVLRDASKQGAAKRAMSLTRLSKPTAMNNMSPVSLSFAYSYSSAAAYTIAEKYGRKGLLRLLSAYNSEKVKGSGSKLTDSAVKHALKLSLSSLKSDVDAYASSHSRF